MLGRLFKKTTVEDERSHYRRAPGRGDALGVKIVCANGAAITGVLTDLSAGGAAIAFDQDMSGDLALGEVRELVFCSLTTSPIRAAAIVRSVPGAVEPRSFGFEFLDETTLFEKLDDAMLRFFNRRRFRRAKPAIGERFRAVMKFDQEEVEADVRDVSMRGVGLAVTDAVAARLAVDESIPIELFVPGTDHVIRVEGTVRHLTRKGKGVRAGLSMETGPEEASTRSGKRAVAALSDYIQRRLDEIERYNSAFE